MNKKHIPIIIGIALPIIFIVIISAVLFLPSLSIKPQHDFLYTSDSSYYSYNQSYKNRYEVKNGRVVLEPVVSPAPENDGLYRNRADAPALYRYSIATGSSHQVTIEEIASVAIDPGPSSPDGYSVEYNYGHSGIFELFGSSRNDYGYFITKGNGKKKLNGLTTVNGSYYNQGSFKLVGWVE